MNDKNKSPERIYSIGLRCIPSGTLNIKDPEKPDEHVATEQLYKMEDKVVELINKITDWRARKLGEDKWLEATPTELLAILDRFEIGAGLLAARTHIETFEKKNR